MTRSRTAGRGLAFILFILLSACTIGPPAKELPASYDLGPQRPGARSNPQISATLLVPGVAAPTWLDHTGIAYRLSYQDAARHQVYANSRWIAAPAALLTQRIRREFSGAASGVVANAEGVRADYALHVELQDFSQTFDSPEASRATVAARATLVRLADRTLRAQRDIAIERPASPDAAGAVRALAEASDALVRELLQWTANSTRGEKLER